MLQLPTWKATVIITTARNCVLFDSVPWLVTLSVWWHSCTSVTSGFDQTARRSHNIKIYNSSFERVEGFKYLGTTLTNQNSSQEEIKSRYKRGNACYHSVQNLLSYSLLFKNLKININRTIILHVVLYGCETWSLTLREELTLRVLENRVLGEYLCLRGTMWQGSGENYIMRSLMICTPHPILFGW